MKNKIFIIGDSLVYGSWDPDGGGWVERLRKYFNQEIEESGLEDDECRVYNLGIPGNTSKDLLNRIEFEINERVKNSRKTEMIIVIAVGINDSAFIKSLNNNWVPVEEFSFNLELLQEKANKFTKNVVFSGLININDSITSPASFNADLYYKNDYVDKYDKEIEKFCAKNNLPFIDLRGLMTEDDWDDGLHPNSKGHEKIFRKVKGFLINNKII